MKVKKRSLILFISLVSLVLVYFTNCAGNLEMSTGLNSLCINKNCYSSSNDKLALNVDEKLYLEEFDFNKTNSATQSTTVDAFVAANESGASVPLIHMCMVDVGGSCNDGGFDDNIIEWELLNSNNTCSLKSKWAENKMIRIYKFDTPPKTSVYKLTGKCENGYFNVKVLYPCYFSGVANNMQLLSNTFGYYWQGPRNLRLKIIGIDKDGISKRSSKPYDAEITLNFPGQSSSSETCPE